MRHRKAGRKLGRTASHRKALMANLAVSLLLHKKIKTTVEKAKEARSFIERLITIAKKDTVAARREVRKRIRSRQAINELFQEVAPKYSNRSGGYTRVIKLGTRNGDTATLAFLELVDFEHYFKAKRDQAEKKKAAKEKKQEEQEKAAPSESAAQ